MTEQADENAALETLRCIFCQRKTRWPKTELYPPSCLHCGRSPAYTADRTPPGKM